MTQRGNGRRFLLESDGERRVYLDLLRESLAANKVQLVGYCLMSNHVHLIVVPQDAEGSYTVGGNKTTAVTDGYTYFSYDSLGRKTLQTQPDGATKTWKYTANLTDFYDEGNSHWQWAHDSLGRLVKTLENDPAGSGSLTLETDYTYDALDNLLTLNQQGASGDVARYRAFNYKPGKPGKPGDR